MIARNEPFICEKCGKHNTRAQKTCRDHCRNCLFSRHVDEKVPGDRLSACHGMMKPIFVDYDGKKGYQITYECLNCGKNQANKLAPDDNMEVVTEIMQMQNLRQTPSQSSKKTT